MKQKMEVVFCEQKRRRSKGFARVTGPLDFCIAGLLDSRMERICCEFVRLNQSATHLDKVRINRFKYSYFNNATLVIDR